MAVFHKTIFVWQLFTKSGVILVRCPVEKIDPQTIKNRPAPQFAVHLKIRRLFWIAQFPLWPPKKKETKVTASCCPRLRLSLWSLLYCAWRIRRGYKMPRPTSMNWGNAECWPAVTLRRSSNTQSSTSPAIHTRSPMRTSLRPITPNTRETFTHSLRFLKS